MRNSKRKPGSVAPRGIWAAYIARGRKWDHRKKASVATVHNNIIKTIQAMYNYPMYVKLLDEVVERTGKPLEFKVRPGDMSSRWDPAYLTAKIPGSKKPTNNVIQIGQFYDSMFYPIYSKTYLYARFCLPHVIFHETVHCAKGFHHTKPGPSGAGHIRPSSGGNPYGLKGVTLRGEELEAIMLTNKFMEELHRPKRALSHGAKLEVAVIYDNTYVNKHSGDPHHFPDSIYYIKPIKPYKPLR